jgi:hypothetical protein
LLFSLCDLGDLCGQESTERELATVLNPAIGFAMADMQRFRAMILSRVLVFSMALLVWKVTLSVVVGYRDYAPPNFDSDFLRGREAYFWGAYGWAFYIHLASGPLSLILGTILISDRFRKRFPTWHRRLGRIQGICVLLLVAPSGLWMARYAMTGAVAAAGLGSLAVATAACVVVGWRAAVLRRFAEHRRWMWRTFLLLCSAVVIRLIGGLATVAHWDALWIYPLSAWVSWLAPLLVYEASQFISRPGMRIATSIHSTT